MPGWVNAVQKVSDGAGDYTDWDGITDLRGGNYPVTWYLSGSAAVAATAVDNTEIYASSDVSMYNYHLIENTSTTDGVTIQISIDGTNYSTDAAVLLHDDVTTGGGIKVLSIPAGDFASLEGKFFSIKALKDGTTNEAPSIRYAHSNK